jgi:predicted transglutaminase-like cysteine proteinase
MGRRRDRRWFANLAQGTVCKILDQEKMKPHKVRYCLEKRDQTCWRLTSRCVARSCSGRCDRLQLIDQFVVTGHSVSGIPGLRDYLLTMDETRRFSSRAIQSAASVFRGIGSAAPGHARRLLMRILVGVLMTLGGVNAAVSSERPGNPFDGSTVSEFNDPLVGRWNILRQQMQLDDLIVSSCIEDEADDCTAAKKLMDVVDEAQQYQGRAVLGHVNRSINLMIKPAAGNWTSALDILQMGSGDCKDYSIAKYAALLRAGISPAHIRLIIVYNRARKEEHMVVSVYDSGQWLLLDNLTMLLVRDADRKGYVPMYVLDETGVRRYIRGSS